MHPTPFSTVVQYNMSKGFPTSKRVYKPSERVIGESVPCVLVNHIVVPEN